jgi:hypothetical protein
VTLLDLKNTILMILTGTIQLESSHHLMKDLEVIHASTKIKETGNTIKKRVLNIKLNLRGETDTKKQKKNLKEVTVKKKLMLGEKNPKGIGINALMICPILDQGESIVPARGDREKDMEKKMGKKTIIQIQARGNIAKWKKRERIEKKGMKKGENDYADSGSEDSGYLF